MSSTSRDASRAALRIIESLRAAGHVAYLAGGCVRDRLLGRAPKDYDVATDAPPERVQALFPRARQVGAKFGVMLVRRNGCDIEVATFRCDGDYTDGRHPDHVTFGTERDDALRRDFTINGMFLDPVADRVIDYVGGQSDLRLGVVRTIGQPDRRFEEDHLRMLRAVRFSARFGFPLDEATRAAIVRQARHLTRISAERIWLELEMILTEPTRAIGWSLMVETGLRGHLAASWRRDQDDEERLRARLTALPNRLIDPALALSATLVRRPRREVIAVCRDLRLSNRLTHAVAWLVGSLPAVHQSSALGLAELKLLMAEAAWPLLLDLLAADVSASGGDLYTVERLRSRASNMAPGDVTPPPLLTGDDLTALGVPAGPRMGELLKSLYHAQLNETIVTRDQAVALLRGLLGA